ncbi:hypothetical protein BBBOND_0201600 [Babesia bigemina]|uniref:Uncharacterized protein n=1 Tax=Babesia bigemina TaxID=5866 RepID=A0A061D310_BABBI|nr:hypothetical protein BBBOND_0201600 [Babesia bigemina]CDR95003.1 hypothetical protein BBBOND_0201600 [Babesia bigemina]|eukprot:XP_012767189.1 hypothetical protein BBBOND_0201600 [Babesia bigemina]
MCGIWRVLSFNAVCKQIIELAVEDNRHYAEPTAGCILMGVRLLACLLFLETPPFGTLLWYHLVELATLGATYDTANGVYRPVMTNVIKHRYHATRTGITKCLSGYVGAITYGSMFINLLKAFGHISYNGPLDTVEAAVKEVNAEAIRKSMMYLIVSSTLLSLVCYFALFSHATDRVPSEQERLKKREKEKKTEQNKMTNSKNMKRCPKEQRLRLTNRRSHSVLSLQGHSNIIATRQC